MTNIEVSQPLRVGIGGPVGSGKTALTLALCRALRDDYEIAVVTNDIYTEEDAQFLVTQRGACRRTASSASRPAAVRTRRFARTRRSTSRPSIASRNASAISIIVFVESGGDNLAATFSPELSDLTLYVIDVAAGDKIPRKGGPGITKSDLLVINKIDLAPMVGASLEVMERDTRRMRGERPFVFTNLKDGPWTRLRGALCYRTRHAAAAEPSAPCLWRLAASPIWRPQVPAHAVEVAP